MSQSHNDTFSSRLFSHVSTTFNAILEFLRGDAVDREKRAEARHTEILEVLKKLEL
jgi:hypothetical protein